MKWSSNNKACKTVWSALMALDQIDEDQSFKSTGQMKISELRFFPKDETQDEIDIRAKSLALQMDKIFRMIRGASYQEGVSRVIAVTKITDILKVQEQLVADLADKTDDKYLFVREDEL